MFSGRSALCPRTQAPAAEPCRVASANLSSAAARCGPSPPQAPAPPQASGSPSLHARPRRLRARTPANRSNATRSISAPLPHIPCRTPAARVLLRPHLTPVPIPESDTALFQFTRPRPRRPNLFSPYVAHDVIYSISPATLRRCQFTPSASPAPHPRSVISGSSEHRFPPSPASPTVLLVIDPCRVLVVMVFRRTSRDAALFPCAEDGPVTHVAREPPGAPRNPFLAIHKEIPWAWRSQRVMCLTCTAGRNLKCWPELQGAVTVRGYGTLSMFLSGACSRVFAPSECRAVTCARRGRCGVQCEWICHGVVFTVFVFREQAR